MMTAAASTRMLAFVGALVLLPFTGRCQQPFPTYADNGTWSVLSCITGIGTTCSTETHAYDSADTFCGHTWSVYTWPSFGDPNIAYIRNEGQRTLLRRSSDCLDKEYVIYDFSMGVGDSVYAPMTMDIMDPDTTLFILQDIDTVEIFGIERRRFSLIYSSCNDDFVNAPMEWIEGIGSTMHPFYPVDCLCDFCEQQLTLLCCDSAGVHLYLNPVYQTCDTLMTSVAGHDAKSANTMQVWFDETDRSLSIRFGADDATNDRPGQALVLLTSDGRTVKRQGSPTSTDGPIRMDVASVVPGAYVLIMTDDRAHVAAQRIVIR